LRSYNRRMPEEINRVLTDHVSTLLFVPSVTAKDNLAREGITSGVHMVGDVMYDAVLYYRGRITSNDKEPYAVLTVHRAENTDDPARLAGILRGIATAELPVRWPIHPRTRNALVTHGLEAPQNVEFCEPVSYLEMIALVSGASFVLTDSGGLQKEAYFHRVPCITLRSETEWVETIETGWNRLWQQEEKKTNEAYALTDVLFFWLFLMGIKPVVMSMLEVFIPDVIQTRGSSLKRVGRALILISLNANWPCSILTVTKIKMSIVPFLTSPVN